MGGVRALIPFVALAAALALLVPGSSSAASPTVPLFNFGENGHALGEPVDVDFDAFNLDATLSPERFTISIPQSFGAALGRAVGAQLGVASVITTPAGGGAQTEFDGQTLVMDAGVFAADPAAEACSPGSHTAVWQLAVSSHGGQSLSIPIAVDSSPGGYELTMCFDNEQTQSLKVSEVYFQLKGMFRNPTAPGQYLVDGVVTPFGTDGKPSAPSAYEVRAYAVLPQTLTATATYNRVTKIFSVSGVSKLNGKPRSDVAVHIYTGPNADGTHMTLIGSANTAASGAYTFSKKLSTAPKFMVGEVDHYYRSICPNATQPGGCVSDTTDGRETFITPVHVVTPPHKKK